MKIRYKPTGQTAGILSALVLFTFLATVVSAQTNLPSPANWISNPSFETGSADCPVDWFFANQQETTTGGWTNASAHSGSGGARITGQTGLSFGRWMTPYRMYLEPGKRYRVSFWYRGNGAGVHLIGHPVTLDANGSFQVNLYNNYKRVIASGLSSASWTYFETNFVASGSGIWAQLCLVMETGNKTAEFDDVAIARPGLVVIDPIAPAVTALGMTNSIVVYCDTLRTNDLSTVDWSIDSTNLTLRSVALDTTNRTWTLGLEATAAGVADLTLRATPDGGSLITNRLARFARVRPGTGGPFAFAVVADAQIYQSVASERNERFGQMAASLNALDPLFAISLGDQMDESAGLWDEEKIMIADAGRTQFGRLACPLFALPGLHESDRFYEGSQTRWYHEKYLKRPAYFSLEVEGTLIAGVDTTPVGAAERESGGGFLRLGQAEWLAAVLGSYTGRLPIVAGHVAPYDEFGAEADRDLYLGLLYTNRVRAVLAGHRHETLDQGIRNPAVDGQTSPPWSSNLTTLADAAAGIAMLADPSNTVFLTTVTACADLQGAATFRGYRYLLVRDQQIAWQDVLPLSLSVTCSSSAPNTVTFHLTNGSDKAVSGLPLHVELPAGVASAELNGSPLVVQATTLPGGRQEVWAQADIGTNMTAEVVFRSSDPLYTLTDFESGTAEGWLGGTDFPDTILSIVSGDTPDASTYALKVTLDTPTGQSYLTKLFSPAMDWSTYTHLRFWTKSPQPTYTAWIRLNNQVNVNYHDQILSPLTWTQVSIALTNFIGVNQSTVTEVSPRWTGDQWTNGAAILFDRFELYNDMLTDSDGDGIPDAWELKHGLNPSVSNSATANVDGDWMTDYEEYIADTHPTNGDSFWPPLLLDDISNILFTGTSTARIYRLSSTTNLTAVPQFWQAASGPSPGNGGTVTMPIVLDVPWRAYRGSVEVP
ncbi:MAG: metallophosphoesterase [Verrucomicrobia bacterium]|nr:metallophosphoesterase [Verrucomicrobiota bacterium]